MILRFTIGNRSGRRGIRTLTPRGAHSLAPRPGQPYPATFRRMPVDPPGVEPGSPPRQGGVVPLDHEPSFLTVDRRGVEPRSPDCDTGVVPLDQQPAIGRVDSRGVEPRFPACKAGVFPLDEPPVAKVCPRIELGPPPYHGGVLPEHLQTVLWESSRQDSNLR